jgi:hypothetical protein
MLILIILASIFILSLIGLKVFYDNWDWEGICGVTAVISGILLGLLLLCFPINKMSTNSDIAKFNSARVTYESVKYNKSSLENTIIQTEIIKENMWLAEAKYYRTTMWKIWVPKEIDSFQPIK